MKRVELLSDREHHLWADFVHSRIDALPSHLCGWKEVLEGAFPHLSGFYLVVREGASGSITAGVPVYLVRSAVLGSRLISVPFATLCDPLVSASDEFDLIVRKMLELRREYACRSVELRTCFLARQALKSVCMADLRYRHHYVELDREPERLWPAFHPTSVRQPLRKALSGALRLVRGQQAGCVRRFYHLYVSTRRRLGLPAMPLRFFTGMWRRYGHTGEMTVLFACLEDVPVATAVLLHSQQVTVLEVAADDYAHRGYYPNHFLYWHSIVWAYSRGSRLFSFGRTSVNNTGLMQFKDRWGATAAEMPILRYPAAGDRPSAEGRASSVRALARKAMRHFPAPVYRAIGDLWYSNNA